jgi:hypothetical protein
MMKRVNLYLPDGLIEQIHSTASEQGTTFSSLTREILEGYVSGTMTQAGSGFAATKEELARIETLIIDQGNQLKDVKAVLDLILHFAKRSAEK